MTIKGGSHTEEAKRKNAEAHKRLAKTNPNYGMRGKHHTEESNQKNSEAHLGKRASEETKRKISEGGKGRQCPKSPEHRAKISQSLMGNTPWNKGKKLSAEHCKNLSTAHVGYRPSPETLAKMSAAFSMEKNPAWQGGKSFEPYTREFKRELRQMVRERDCHSCQLCWKSREENGKELDVHHIDYDKQNNDPRNLIALCGSCHGKTKGNAETRDYYQNYFENFVIIRAA